MKLSSLVPKTLLIALLMTALIASGCGSDTTDSKSAEARLEAAATPDTGADPDKPKAAKPANDSIAAQKAAIKETVAIIYRSSVTGDAEKSCALISKGAVKEFLASATLPDGGKAKTCKQYMKAQAAAATKPTSEQLKQALATIDQSLKDAKITINGDQAVITTGDDKSGSETHLVKEGGRWKLAKP